MADTQNLKLPAYQPARGTLQQRQYSSTSMIPRPSDYDEEPSEHTDLEAGHANDEANSETKPLLAGGPRISKSPKIPEDSTASCYSRAKPSTEQPLKLTKRSSTGAKKEIDTIQLADEIRGALIFKIPKLACCKDYTVRIYLHYWIWQIPVLMTNIILFCIWNTTHNNPNPTIALTEVGFLAVGPVFLSALVRDKVFLWGVYWAVKKSYVFGCTKYARYHISRLADCIGGLHSSLGVTSLVWNVIYAIGAFIREGYVVNMRSGTAWCLPFLLMVICISALPCVRHHCHNSFEIVHRYLNWLALCLLITHVTLVNVHQAPTIEEALQGSPCIFALLLIVLTVYPWVILHRIKGRDMEIVPANSSTAFIFPWWAPMGAVCKVSTDFVEFHVMGITPLPYDEEKGHRCFILMKSLGDWTSSINERAKVPGLLDDTTFYMSRIKPPNFTQGLFNWRRVFVLTTGAGIAPLIPYVVNTDYLQIAISLVWVARDHANNYPKFLVDILDPISNVVLYDTTKMPRPNLCTLTVEKAREFDAEAVFIVSNPKMAYHVSNYVIKHGIPVFASNFDV